MKYIKLIVLTFALVLSCKTEEKTPVIVPKVKEPSKLELKITYKTDKVDVIQCVFSDIEIESDEQSGAYVITQDTEIKESFKTKTFSMFNNDIVQKVQLRLGRNPKKVEIEEILITYGEKEVIVKGKEVNRYFAINKFIDFDSESKTLETKKIDGKHSPILTLRKAIIDKVFDLK